MSKNVDIFLNNTSISKDSNKFQQIRTKPVWLIINVMNRFHIKNIIIVSVLPKGRSFTPNSGTKAVVLPEGRSSTAISGTKAAGLLGIKRCGCFPHPTLSLASEKA